jgi:hypothetical protein
MGLQYLPTTEEQGWLITHLAAQIAAGGEAQFVEMPVLEPTRKYFPDPWSFSHQGLDRLVRRLMQYAGLGGLDVKIGTYIELKERTHESSRFGHRSTAGLFMGIVEGQCLFAFNEAAPADAEYMAGVMCHEVAHAYRSHHGLAQPESREEEELITDLTTVYLGFGIFSANNSFRSRTAGWSAGALAFHSWSVQSTGYLPPQAFGFLLAIQMVARNLSPSERRHLLKLLEPDQAAFTEAALQEVCDREQDILETLRLTPRARRGPAKRLDEILRPLPEYGGPESSPASPPASEPVLSVSSRPVFRVPKNRTHQFGPLGAIFGLGIGVVGALLLQQPVIVLLGVVTGGMIGLYRGSRTCFEVCSDPTCKAVLPATDHCPNCGRYIAGTISHENDRLEAEEEWEQQRPRSASERPRARKIRLVASDDGETQRPR